MWVFTLRQALHEASNVKDNGVRVHSSHAGHSQDPSRSCHCGRLNFRSISALTSLPQFSLFDGCASLFMRKIETFFCIALVIPLRGKVFQLKKLKAGKCLRTNANAQDSQEILSPTMATYIKRADMPHSHSQLSAAHSSYPSCPVYSPTSLTHRLTRARYPRRSACSSMEDSSTALRARPSSKIFRYTAPTCTYVRHIE